MATQPYLTWEQYQALPPNKRSRPLTPAEYAAAMQRSEGGAPADFNGPVFPNPDHIVISDDTDSGIPDMRLPNGVQAVTGGYNGTPKLDTSNPAAAQVLPAAMQTIGAKTTAPPQSLPADFNQWDKAPETLPADFDKWDAHPKTETKTETKTEEQPGILDREIPLTSHWNATLQGLQNIARGGKQAVTAAYEMGKLPTNKEEWAAFVAGGPLALAAYRSNKGLADTVKGAAEVPGAIHDINQSADPTGTYMQVAGRTAGEGAGQALVALATEGAGKVAPKVVKASGKAASAAHERVVAPTVRAAGRAVERVSTPKNLARAAGATGGSVTLPIVGPVGGGLVAGEAAEAVLGPEVANRPLVRAPRMKNYGAAQKSFDFNAKPSTQTPKPSNAAAARVAPETAVVEDLEGVTSPQTEYAGETPIEQVPEETQNAAAARAKVDTSPKKVEQLLTQATGGKKLVPGVPLKNQPAAMGTKLPADFTPVENSSLLKGYKYDPATQEFDAITHSGERYRHGQVSPEQFQKFEAADSKGQAWNKEIKGGAGVAPLGKVDAAGKLTPRNKPQFMRSVEVDPETGQPEFSDVLEQKRKNLQDFITPEKQAAAETKPAAKTTKTKTKAAPAPAEDDLLSKLQQSVEQAKAGKGGVMASADPEELAKRWGVDEESLKAGREQTRGWRPMETEAELKKLEARYRKGQPVEPVMETRDANNNLIDVDGRGRAIAAKRAGVKRIPVIVRRIGVQ